MEDSGGMPLVMFIVPAFLVFFSALWLSITALLSFLSGWGKLAKRYPAEREFDGQRWTWQSAQMGVVGIRGCLTAGANREGLYLAMMLPFRFRHPPLFIPWRAVQPVPKQMLFFRGVEFRVGPEPVVTVWVRETLAERLRLASV